MAFYSDTFLLHITARFIGFRLLLEDLKKTEAVEVESGGCVGDVTQFRAAAQEWPASERARRDQPVLAQPPLRLYTAFALARIAREVWTR